MPNAFAYLMISIWPLIAWQLWRRLDPARALIWTILGGYLILPPLTAINLPVVPDLDKNSIPALSALAFALFLRRDRISFDPGGWAGRVFLGLFVLSPFATVLTNAEPVTFEIGALPGMRLYDSVAAVANQAIALLPFFLGRRYLASPEAMKALLWALVAAALAYSLPMLVEARLSPQINVWVYGFFQHDFFQTIRYGGYRPVVFLPHGLWVAFFVVMSLAATATLLRAARPDDRPRLAALLCWMVVLLVLCRSAGPVVYALGLLPLLLLAGVRTQLLVAAGLSLVVVVYPLLRGAHLVPLQAIMDLAAGISGDRALSLEFRIDNEERLLDHAMLKPWFGWGGYERNLIHDLRTGATLTIADGAWIIVLGIYGWVGYIAQFGLTALPLWRLGAEALRKRIADLSPWVGAVALILAANMVDMLPNATQIPFTWLMAGALLGHAELLSRVRARAEREVRLAGPAQRRTVL